MISLHWFYNYMKGHIWRTGFESHEIKGVVFDDVPPALEKWHSSGIKVLAAPPLLINLYMWICKSNWGTFYHLSSTIYTDSITAQLLLNKVWFTYACRRTYIPVVAEKPRGSFSGTPPTGTLESTCVDFLTQQLGTLYS